MQGRFQYRPCRHFLQYNTPMEKEYSPEEKLEIWQENLRWEDTIRREFIAMVEESLADPTGLTRDLDPTEPLEYAYTRWHLQRDIMRMRGEQTSHQNPFASREEFDEGFDSLLNNESDASKIE